MKEQKTFSDHQAKLRIKVAMVEDIPVIRQMALAIWPEAYQKILSRPQIDYMLRMMYSEQSLTNQMSRGDRFLIIEKEGRDAGFASYGATEKAGIYKLHKIYIDVSAQGQGLGKQLIEYICGEVFAEGARYLDLNVNRNNPAKTFYEKLGFHVIAEENIDIGNDYQMNDYVMRKTIVLP